ncbi:hypothetical protein V2J09_016628 [Rumex salicifolius]
MGGAWIIALMTLLVWSASPTASVEDTNAVYSPCTDTTIKRLDGFTLGLAFSSRDKFFFKRSCPLEIPVSGYLLQGPNSPFSGPESTRSPSSPLTTAPSTSASGGYMVAFAGNKYAATSTPTFVADAARVVTNFTLVMEFWKGVLYKFDCKECEAEECVDHQDCTVQASKCKGDAECNVGINVMFSGTDKHHKVLTSWYAINSLREYSLFGMYSTLRNRITNLF